MSITRQTTETGADHLSKEKPSKKGSNLTASKPREFWCTECLFRVTRSSDGCREYGHARACSHHAVTPNGFGGGGA